MLYFNLIFKIFSKIYTYSLKNDVDKSPIFHIPNSKTFTKSIILYDFYFQFIVHSMNSIYTLTPIHTNVQHICFRICHSLGGHARMTFINVTVTHTSRPPTPNTFHMTTNKI